jgi:hypothetical protein
VCVHWSRAKDRRHSTLHACARKTLATNESLALIPTHGSVILVNLSSIPTKGYCSSLTIHARARPDRHRQQEAGGSMGEMAVLVASFASAAGRPYLHAFLALDPPFAVAGHGHHRSVRVSVVLQDAEPVLLSSRRWTGRQAKQPF